MRISKAVLLLILLPVMGIAPVWSQPGGNGAGMRGGGQGGGPGGMRNSPKRRLNRWMGGVERLEAGRKAPLNKAQAKKIVTLITPWRTRKTMSDDQAKVLVTGLSGVLTTAQKSEVDRRPDGNRQGGREGGGPGGPPPGGRQGGGPQGGNGQGGRPQGGGGGMGGPGGGMNGQRPTAAQMDKMRGFMNTYNPLASPRLNPGFSAMPARMQERQIERFRELDTFLKKLSQKGR